MSRTAKWAIASLFLADGIGFGVWAAHVPVIQTNLHLDTAGLSFILLSLVAGSILSMPLAGFFITKFSSRSTVRVSAACYILAIALLAAFKSHWAFMLGAGLFGASKGALDVSVNAQALAVEAHEQRSCINFCQGCWSVGGLFGSGISSVLLHHHFTASTDLFLCAGVLFLVCLPSFKGGLVADPFAQKQESGGSHFDPYLIKLAILAFFGLFAEGSVGDWAAVYLHLNVGTTLSWAAAGYAGYAICMAASRFTGGWLLARFSEANVLFGSGVLVAIGFSTFLLAPTWPLGFAGLGLTGVGMANIVPIVIKASERSTRMSAGAAISMVSTVGYFGLLAGPPLIGWVAHATTLRFALILIITAGLIVAAGPRFTKFSTEESSEQAANPATSNQPEPNLVS